MMKNSQQSNSMLSEEPRAVPKKETSADIFYELREKKRKEPKTVSSFPAADPPPPKTPNAISRLFVAALLGGILGFGFSFLLTGANATTAKNDSPRKQFSKPIPRSPSNESALQIEKLKTKYDAVSWADSVDCSRRENPFSIELEDAFIRSDARPVLVRCTLLDIAYANLGIVAKFEIPGSSEGFKNVLILETRKDQLKIFASAMRGISEYAVVAKCTSAQGNEGGGRIILGRLIDVVPLEGK